jgi:hypothetical protein
MQHVEYQATVLPLELLLRAGELDARILIGEGLQPLAVFGA